MIPGWETEWEARLRVLGVWTYIRSFILEVLEKIAGVTRKSQRQVEGLVPIRIFCVHTRQPGIPSASPSVSRGVSNSESSPPSVGSGRTPVQFHGSLGCSLLFALNENHLQTMFGGSNGFHKLQRTTGMERTVQEEGSRSTPNSTVIFPLTGFVV